MSDMIGERVYTTLMDRIGVVSGLLHDKPIGQHEITMYMRSAQLAPLQVTSFSFSLSSFIYRLRHTVC